MELMTLSLLNNLEVAIRIVNMPVKYIGRKTDFSGKTLWEILGNLRNCGIGRLVKRQMFERYPEPSFFRIIKVEAVAPYEGSDRKVRAWVEKVFRGRRYPKLVELYSASYKADYRLIPKSEEKAHWERVENTNLEEKVIRKYIPFPPLLAEMLKEEMKKSGKPVTEPMLPLHIRKGRDNFYKCEDDPEPAKTSSDHKL